MENFTKSETSRIDKLYGTDFEGTLTNDDVLLIARFERMKAMQQLEYENKNKEIENDLNIKSENAKIILDATLNSLNEQHARAMARLDNLDKRKI